MCVPALLCVHLLLLLQLASPNLISALFALLRSLDVHFRLRLGLPVLAHGAAADAPVAPLVDSATPAPAAPAAPTGAPRPPSRIAHQDSRVARSRVKGLATLTAEHDGRVGVCVVALQAVQSLRLLCSSARAEVVAAVEVRRALLAGDGREGDMFLASLLPVLFPARCAP